jgi:hypothetical protein
MFICNPVKGFKIATDTIFEAVSFAREQLDDGAGNNIVSMKYAEQQVHALAYLEPMSTHDYSPVLQ